MKLSVCFDIHIYVHRGSASAPRDKKSERVVASPSPGFSVYADKEIECTRKNRRHSTASNYRTAVRSFLEFSGGKDVPLAKIHSGLIDDYGEWLQQKGISKDTLSCYMRSLRALYNKAVNKGLVQQCDPFRNVFTGITRTRKRAVEKEDLRKLREADVKSGSFIQLVRDVFLFCFYACGMPFVDVAFLKKSQVVDGYINYSRRKTDQPVSIKLEPCMEEIINRYCSNEREYVFPFLSSSDEDEAYREYRQKYSHYNKTLKQLGKIAGIGSHLSSYVPRHTWATLAFRSSVDMSVISQALGHTNTKTTRIYVKDIGSDKLNLANKKLLEEVVGRDTSVQEYKLTEKE